MFFGKICMAFPGPERVRRAQPMADCGFAHRKFSGDSDGPDGAQDARSNSRGLCRAQTSPGHPAVQSAESGNFPSLKRVRHRPCPPYPFQTGALPPTAKVQNFQVQILRIGGILKVQGGLRRLIQILCKRARNPLYRRLPGRACADPAADEIPSFPCKPYGYKEV